MGRVRDVAFDRAHDDLRCLAEVEGQQLALFVFELNGLESNYQEDSAAVVLTWPNRQRGRFNMAEPEAEAEALDPLDDISAEAMANMYTFFDPPALAAALLDNKLFHNTFALFVEWRPWSALELHARGESKDGEHWLKFWCPLAKAYYPSLAYYYNLATVAARDCSGSVDFFMLAGGGGGEEEALGERAHQQRHRY
jgi:hypothetical protein